MSEETKTGWIGELVDLIKALEEAGAEQDREGTILVYGVPVHAGMDKSVVVHANSLCKVNGEARSIADIMKATGKGTPIVVM